MGKTTITVNLHMSVNTVPQLLAALKALQDSEVVVGVPEDKDARNEADGPNNATLAAIQNYGSPARNIPAREFMESGIAEVKDRITKGLVKTGNMVLDGDVSGVDRGLNAVGLIAANGIKNRIATGAFTPLKASTLAARRRRGRTGTKPLQDTGQMRNAISYVVRKRKGN